MRDLSWDGYPNCRDLGGLPTASGARTQYGRIARGPRRELLSPAGWAAARAWGLRTVVDLRCPYETGAQPGDPEQTDPGEVAVVSSPTEDHTNEEFRRVCFPILDSPAYWPHQVEILPGMLRDTLVRVAQARPGILVHCSAGRDRTGLVCALLLATAGVAAELIADDYATSVRVMAQVASHSPTADQHQGRSPEQVEQWVGQTRPLVLDFVAATDRHLAAIGLQPAVRDRLRTLLLAPAPA